MTIQTGNEETATQPTATPPAATPPEQTPPEQATPEPAAPELSGNTLLTKQDAAAPSGENNAEARNEETAGKNAAGNKAPDTPEGYALQFAEGANIDQELLTDFQKTAHELGISRDTAQKLASLYEGHAAKALGAQQKVLDAAREKWEKEIQESPAFEKERDHARSALRQYGDKELYELLDQTNLGSHPKMWAFLAKVGSALAEPGFHGTNAGAAKKSAADVLYPNQGK